MARGGKREGAGRTPGWQLRRSAADLIRDLEEKHPGWSPLHLLAEVANDETQDISIRVDAAKAAAPFMHPRPKPIEMEPEAYIALEERLAKARFIEDARMASKYPMAGLAERLASAARRAAEYDAEVNKDTPTTTFIQEVVTAPIGEAEETQEAAAPAAMPARGTGVASLEPAAAIYRPIAPKPEPIPFSRPGPLMTDDYDPYGAK